MEIVIDIRKWGTRGREKKWLNLSGDHLIKMCSYSMLPGCLRHALCGHHGAEKKEAKAEDGAGSAQEAQALQG